MADSKIYFGLDVESLGLHGMGFAYGVQVIRVNGQKGRYEVLQEDEAWCAPSEEEKSWYAPDDVAWVGEHVMPALDAGAKLLPYKTTAPRDTLHTRFWALWAHWRKKGALMVCDCPWPVEARFLNYGVNNGFVSKFDGPYPLIDVGSVRLAVGLDPLGTEDRLSTELPKHSPLCDTRQSNRLFVEALEKIR